MERDVDEIERIDGLDEAKIIGYFESIRSVFLVNLSFLVGVESTQPSDDFYKYVVGFAAKVPEIIAEPLGLKALERGNWQVRENLKDDLVTSSLLNSWGVFEQITREVPNPGYANDSALLTASFERNVFGFTKEEKEDLQLFQYFRHAIMHYNGAYYAYRSIDHTYAGNLYQSKGHCGEKIVISPKTAWTILLDLEKYSLKAWTAVRGEQLRSSRRA
jgi:hypothetical protein